jgi:hypothetical protein
MKRGLTALVAALLLGCVRQLPEPLPSQFPLGAQPIPPRALLERFYRASRTVDNAATDTVIQVVVQANFRNAYVRCTQLDGPPTLLSLSLRRHSAVRGATGALLGIEYRASEGLLSGTDRSFHFMLDGAAIEPGPVGDPIPGPPHSQSEIALFSVSAETLRRIIDAGTANARLTGRAGRCEFPISGHARGLIALFMERELAG